MPGLCYAYITKYIIDYACLAWINQVSEHLLNRQSYNGSERNIKNDSDHSKINQSRNACALAKHNHIGRWCCGVLLWCQSALLLQGELQFISTKLFFSSRKGKCVFICFQEVTYFVSILVSTAMAVVLCFVCIIYFLYECGPLTAGAVYCSYFPL